MALNATRVMNGSFGSVYTADGDWLTNTKSAEATVEINKEEISRAGTRWTGYKVTGLKGSGNISGYRITTKLIEAIGQIKNNNMGAFETELVMSLDDPEAFGAMSVRLMGVTFDQIPLMKYELNSIVEEELPFTFTDYELLETVNEE